MPRLLIHVEGETEESFVNEVLAPHLYASGYCKVSARLLGNARQRDRRGGIRAWNAVRKDILNHLKEDPGCVATTMVDFYGLPQVGERAWPGRAHASTLPFHLKASTIEGALLQDIQSGLDSSFNPDRFIPFVMMHEFEGYLFSDCSAFARGVAQPSLAGAFQSIRDEFPTPEEINDSPSTAPSKRVENLISGYQKPLLGTLAILEIGLDPIKRECPLFNRWLNRLQSGAIRQATDRPTNL